MRWIVASLVFINLLVLLGQLFLPRNDLTAAPNSLPATPEFDGESSLRLLSELDAPARRAMFASKEHTRVVTPPAGEFSQPLCTMVGPFPQLLKAEYFVERLAALDVLSSIQDLEVPGEVGYWVYLPPRESRKQAFNQLRELQAKGIDSYVIPKGELANGISFGMFSQAGLAKNRLEAMRSLGYPAELKEIARSYKEIWVVLSSDQAGRVDQAVWQPLLAAEKGLERRQNFCPPVASR
jgi:hypothetical protein